MKQATDALTGLFLGADLYPRLEALVAKDEAFALVLLDIDHLLPINRDFGRDAGDAVFRLIATQINKLFPSPCIAFRGTRDEFDVLIPGGTKEAAFLQAEQLRRAVCEAVLDYRSAEGEPLRQTVSVGVAAYPEDGSRAADVVRRADSAMVRAKKGGRNQVCLAREEKLLPKTSHYTAAQLEKLSAISQSIQVGEAALLREALDDLLKKYDVDEIGG